MDPDEVTRLRSSPGDLRTPLASRGRRSQSRGFRVVALCIAVYLLLSIAMFLPAWPWNGTRLPSTILGGYGYGDPAQMTWFLAWVPFALEHGMNFFHTNFIDYPGGADLANGTPAPLLGLLSAPITQTLGPIAAFNILLRLAFATSATSMFIVLRAWCRTTFAFLGGLFYGFSPYLIVEGQSHLNLTFVPIPPFILWCVYVLITGRTRRPLRWGLALGVLAALQAYISPELLVLTALVVLLGVIGFAMLEWKSLRRIAGELTRAVVSATGCFVLLCSPLLWGMLFAPGHLHGPALPAATLQADHADLLGAVTPTLYQFVDPKSINTVAALFSRPSISENGSYLSIPLVILVVIIAVRYRRSRLIFASSALAAVALVLSLGPRLAIDGHVFDVPLPEALFAHLGELDGIVPARFSFVVTLFVAIVIGAGGQRLYDDLRKNATPSLSTSALRVSTVILAIASLVLLIPLTFTTKSGDWPSDTETVLDTIPRGAVVLTYPITTETYTEAMSWQADDDFRFRLIGGSATVQGPGNYGQGHAPLLAVPFVQEFLDQAQYGEPYDYPAPSATAHPRLALCDFIHRYHVGALVYWRAGVHPQAALHVFVEVAGRPTDTTSNHAVRVWVLGRNLRCPAHGLTKTK